MQRHLSTPVQMYDKFGRILRIETTSNDVSFFKHHRKVEHQDGTETYELAQLKSLLTGVDSKAVQRSAHTIKGSAANLCTKALHSSSHDLEMAAKSKNLPQARQLLAALETIMSDTIQEIKNRCSIL